MGYDDYEQSERVQEWLRHNGAAIAVGIVIGLALIFGYRQWNKHKASENIDAAVQYQLVQTAIADGKTNEAKTLTDSLVKNHAGSTYAVFAMSLRARQDVDAGKAGDAIAALQWAVQHAPKGPLQDLTRLRLARVQLVANKANDALNTLKAMPAKAYLGLATELRGDAQVKLGHVEAARKAYQSSLADFDANSPQRRIVQMKIDNLAPAAVVKNTAPATAASIHAKQDA
ncbi:MAG TPA: tetratricopeptide repeat protein [Rhodanobacteraceae bacterium]